MYPIAQARRLCHKLNTISPHSLLHRTPPYSVEAHLECAFGLGTMLHAEAEHHNLAFADLKCHGGGFAFEFICTFDPAGEEDILLIFGIPREHGALHPCRRRGGGEGYGRVNECGGFFRHAPIHWMVLIEVDAQQRAGDADFVSTAEAALRSGTLAAAA